MPVPPAPARAPQESLTKLLLFNNLDSGAQRKVVREMYERPIAAGEILIQEGDTGARPLGAACRRPSAAAVPTAAAAAAAAAKCRAAAGRSAAMGLLPGRWRAVAGQAS